MNKPEALRKPCPPELITALHTQFGERFSTSQSIREHHGKDESAFPIAPPDAVVFPQSTAEAVEIVKLCAAHTTNIIPYGVGHFARRPRAGHPRRHLRGHEPHEQHTRGKRR